jgi:hypothetical protein
MSGSSGHPTISSLGGAALRQSDPGDFSDPAFEKDVVQPPQRGSEDCTTTEVSRRPHRSQQGSAGGSVNFTLPIDCPTLTSK